MCNGIILTTLLKRKISAFGILLFAAAAVLLPVSANAQCSGIWDASGKWSFMQRNATRPVELDMRQNGKVISGSASLVIPGSKDFFSPKAGEQKLGKVEGTILGDRLSIEIAWNDDRTGVYNARILPSGRLEGEGYEKSSPNVRHPWNSTGVLKCPPPPPVVPKPIRSSGKAKAEPPKPPFITASQIIIPGPPTPLGMVIMGWDGGPDNPNVEVWLSMDNSVEIPAFSTEHVAQSSVWKLSKIAALQMNLQRYHHYKFVLKNSEGKTLSTTAFVVQ